MIDGHHERIIADAPLRHRLGESVRRRDLDGNGIVGVDDVGRPVDVDRAGDVAGQVFVARTTIIGLLHAGGDLSGHDRPPHVDDAHIRVVQVLGQPVCRDEKVRGHGGVLDPMIRGR